MEKYILMAIVASIVLVLVLSNVAITGLVPGQGQGVPFVNGGTEPPCEDPCEGVDTRKCEDLANNCENICASKGAHAWAVTRNWAIENEGGDPACMDNPSSVYIESCTITAGNSEDPTVCIDVICACYFC